jgi:hypothetical protein
MAYWCYLLRFLPSPDIAAKLGDVVSVPIVLALRSAVKAVAVSIAVKPLAIATKAGNVLKENVKRSSSYQYSDAY